MKSKRFNLLRCRMSGVEAAKPRTREGQPTLLMLQLPLVFMAMTFAVSVAYGVFAASVCDRILPRPGVLRWMRRGFAAAFVGLGVKLALVQR